MLSASSGSPANDRARSRWKNISKNRSQLVAAKDRPTLLRSLMPSDAFHGHWTRQQSKNR